jgi:hypothetical protein
VRRQELLRIKNPAQDLGQSIGTHHPRHEVSAVATVQTQRDRRLRLLVCLS